MIKKTVHSFKKISKISNFVYSPFNIKLDSSNARWLLPDD